MVVEDHARNLACRACADESQRWPAVLLTACVGPAGAVEVEPGVEWTTIARDRGPVRINVLAVDPARVHGVLSNERIARRERVSAMGRRVAAVAGVNGGYFAPSGDPVGVLALDGELLSEPVDGRSALVLPATAPGAAASAPFVAPVRFQGRVTVNGRSREIDGIDRTRGLIPACGGRGGDKPTDAAERGADMRRRQRARGPDAALRSPAATRGRRRGRHP